MMPCWQQVKIEAAIRLKDKALLEATLRGLEAVLDGQVIRKYGLRFQIDEDGSVSASVSSYEAEAAESFLKELKREYALATLTQWAKAQRFAVKRQGMCTAQRNSFQCLTPDHRARSRLPRPKTTPAHRGLGRQSQGDRL